MKAAHLRTEYLDRPIGLDIAAPRLFWTCEGGREQTAYRITASRGGAVIWDSGKVPSAEMTHIPWGGPKLRSRDRVTWSVTLWDENDQPGEAAESWFELGLLSPDEWYAQWITGAYKPKKNTRYPVDCFRKAFTLKRPAMRARLYSTACGLYDAELNGRPVTDGVLLPGSTDYRKRLQYQVTDVTDLLAEENVLTVELADGWYRGSVGCYGLTNVFGRETKLLVQLEIEYADGGRERILSDGSWQWSNDGPIRFADLKDGEVIEAGRVPSYSGMAKVTAAPKGAVLCAGNNVLPKMKERFTPTLLTTPNGQTVLDFGQNLAGFLACTLQGPEGSTVRIRLGECLDADGNFTQKNFQSVRPKKEAGALTQTMLAVGMGEKLPGEKTLTPLQEVTITCSGGIDRYCTRFAVFGFRYALVCSDQPVDPAQFEAVAVYSDMTPAGRFSCSDAAVNRLWQNTLWSMKSNFLDVPTDCPTRERLGWTGDAQIFFRTGAYMMDTASFFRKWLRDMRDNQMKDGKISAVIPFNGCAVMYDNTGGSVGWADAAVLIPWRYYEAYGDEDLLRECWPMMRALAQYMIENTGHKDKKQAKADPFNQYVYEKGVHLGEWLEPEEFQDKIAAGGTGLHTEECTAYLHHTMTVMSRAADLLGEAEEAELYQRYADGAAKAYSRLFLQGGAPDTDRQAKLVRPLALGLGTAQERAALEQRLAQAAVNRGYRVQTGFLSTPYVLPVLSEAGRGDLAYRMLHNKKSPGWLYEVEQGATTIWENWEGNLSQNHYSPGAVCEWLMTGMLGIRQDGVRRFVIAPLPEAVSGPSPADGDAVTSAEGSYDSLYGRVSVQWTVQDGVIRYQIAVPANTAAEVRLPDGTVRTLQGGECVTLRQTVQ